MLRHLLTLATSLGLAGCVLIGADPTVSRSPAPSASSEPAQITSSNRVPLRVEVEATDVALPRGNTRDLKGTVVYSDGTRDGSVSWASSDETVATVDSRSGRLSALSDGQATVTAAAIARPGIRSLVQVIVRAPGSQDLLVRITPASASLKVGQTRSFSATIQDSNGDQGGNVVWSSSLPSVATVNDQGLVTALSAGTATIIATSQKDATRRAEALVEVTD